MGADPVAGPPAAAGGPGIVYYSSRSGNTQRFVARLGLPALRIPIRAGEPIPAPARPYVLICPTYADGAGNGAVPKQVIRFLNDPARRALLCGVVGSGNRNFGTLYAISGNIIARKCNVPLLCKFELAGFETDIARLRAGLEKLGNAPCSTMP